MNKICTSIEQSKKLIELGFDANTADMYWDYDVQKHEYYPMVMDEQFDDTCVRAWSLAALFKMLPYSARLERGSSTELCYVTLPNELESSDWYIEPVDAVFEMILKLYELKML